VALMRERSLGAGAPVPVAVAAAVVTGVVALVVDDEIAELVVPVR
jgi:predicted exporter